MVNSENVKLQITYHNNGSTPTCEVQIKDINLSCFEEKLPIVCVLFYNHEVRIFNYCKISNNSVFD
jgi:hypothetical protein